jgi:hypothetical protein
VTVHFIGTLGKIPYKQATVRKIRFLHMTDLPEIVKVISGKGFIPIDEDYFGALQIMLYTQVLREPTNLSRNFTFNPDKSFYAHICFCIDDFVLQTFDVNFDQQAFIIHEAQAQQDLLSLICAYDGILDSFVVVASALATVISRINLIKNHPVLRFKPNRIRFECYADTALVLTLKGTALDKCKIEDGDNVPPPPPPPPVDKVPPGTPVDVTLPDDGIDDGGDTVPFPIDQPPPPLDFPIGVQCSKYLCIAEITSGLNGTQRRETVFFGVIEDFYFSPQSGGDKPTILITCYGIPLPEGDDVCSPSPTTYVFLQTDLDDYISHEIISVELVP